MIELFQSFTNSHSSSISEGEHERAICGSLFLPLTCLTTNNQKLQIADTIVCQVKTEV